MGTHAPRYALASKVKGSYVEALDPAAQLSLSGNPDVAPLADEVRARMVRG